MVGGGKLKMIALFRICDTATGKESSAHKGCAATLLFQHAQIYMVGKGGACFCAKAFKYFYTVFNFEAKPELIAELERNYRIDDNVMKFITIKKED